MSFDLDYLDRLGDNRLHILSAYSTEFATQKKHFSLQNVVTSSLRATACCSSSAKQICANRHQDLVNEEARFEIQSKDRRIARFIGEVDKYLAEEAKMLLEEKKHFDSRAEKRAAFGTPADHTLHGLDKEIAESLCQKVPEGTKLMFMDGKGVQKTGYSDGVQQDYTLDYRGIVHREERVKFSSDDPALRFLEGVDVAKPSKNEGKHIPSITQQLTPRNWWLSQEKIMMN
jgi:hypothetical protein